MKKILKNILKVLSFIGVFILMVVFTLYASLLLICYGPSKSARNIFTTTFLETGAFKFVVHLVLPNKTINEIVNSNSLKELNKDVDSNLIDVSNKNINKIKKILKSKRLMVVIFMEL